MSWLTIGPVELDALRLSLWVAVVAVALSLPVAVAVAYALARCRFWGHGLLNALVHLPLVLPPVVTGYLLLVVFGRKGTFGPVLEALGDSIGFYLGRGRAGGGGHGFSADCAGHSSGLGGGGPAA